MSSLTYEFKDIMLNNVKNNSINKSIKFRTSLKLHLDLSSNWKALLIDISFLTNWLILDILLQYLI